MWDYIFFGVYLPLSAIGLAHCIDSFITSSHDYCPPCYNFGNKKKFNFLLFVYYVMYAFYFVIMVLLLPFLAPLKVWKYLKLIKNGKLVRVDLDQYCIDFCMDSSYPDQVKYGKINNFNYRPNSGPLRLAKSFSRKNDVFDWNSVHDDAATRFIELLPSLTLFYFSKASTDLYYQCLGLRGLEYSFYSYDVLPVEDHVVFGPPKVQLSKNGRRMGYLESPQNWKKRMDRYVVCRDTFRCLGRNTKILANKTYRQLVLVFWNSNFHLCFEDTLRQLLHEKVDTVKLTIQNYPHSDPLGPSPTLTNIITFLSMCHMATKIGISLYQLVPRYGLVMLKLPATRLGNNPEFLIVKTRLENWARTRPDLEMFKLIYDKRNYMLHDSKLMAMDRLMCKRWYLIEEFALKPSKPVEYFKNNKLFFEMEYPYAFPPYRYCDYLM